MEKINNCLSFNFNNLNSVCKNQTTNPAFKFNTKNYSMTDVLDIKEHNLVDLEVEARTNPNINRLLKQHRLPLSISKKALNELTFGHLRNTQILSSNIYSCLAPELKTQVDLKSLQDASKYHDFGKILIPENILYKKNELNDKEWEIMKLHPELGMELLKNSGLSEKSLNLIKYHHQNTKSNGYPQISSDYNPSIESKILSLADEYMALTEPRCYKEPYSREDALSIIKKDINYKNDKEIFNALVKATNRY